MWAVKKAFSKMCIPGCGHLCPVILHNHFITYGF
uniref:Uncharacterized protein n=1 Tax=Anguilla anguilla TaxID=7936 RepID=A0A0E9QK29_ANGAN